MPGTRRDSTQTTAVWPGVARYMVAKPNANRASPHTEPIHRTGQTRGLRAGTRSRTATRRTHSK